LAALVDRSRDHELEAAWRTARRRDLVWQLLLPVAVIIPVALVWQLAALRPGNLLLPTFTDFVATVGRLLTSSRFWSALETSEGALLLAYVAALAIGVPLGLAMGRARWLEGAVDPYLNIAVVTPMAIVMPLLLMIFGFSVMSRAIVIFVFAFPFVVVPCRAGVLTVSERLQEMARSFGAGELQMWREILLPGALPSIMSGLRQGFAHALTGMIVAELSLLAVGFGRLLLEFKDSFDYASVFATVFLIICQSVIFMAVLTFLERRIGASRTLVDGGS
jgi:ABC-type nitrate/sulfonate/bicarbonate transport system permease component